MTPEHPTIAKPSGVRAGGSHQHGASDGRTVGLAESGGRAPPQWLERFPVDLTEDIEVGRRFPDAGLLGRQRADQASPEQVEVLEWEIAHPYPRVGSTVQQRRRCHQLDVEARDMCRGSLQESGATALEPQVTVRKVAVPGSGGRLAPTIPSW